MLRHQYALGLSSAQARRLAPVGGEFFVDHRAAIPLLFAGRAGRMLSWLVKHHPRALLRGAVCAPLYAAGLFAWCAGFASGAADGGIA